MAAMTAVADRVRARLRLPAAVRAVLDHPVAGPVVKVALGYLVLVEGLVQAVLGRIDLPLVTIPWLEIGTRATPIPRGVFVVGAVVGTLYGLIGMGLILVHRANRILNFAQAQLGAVPAIAALLLMLRKGVPYVLAIPIALVGGALLGGVVEVGVVRRFQRASRLVLTVATVGVGLLLLVLEFAVKRAISGDLLVAERIPTPFSGFSFGIGPVTLHGDHVVTVVVATAAIIGLVAFFRTTNVGIAVRAAAENRDRAALLGIPVDRVSTVVWILAGALSAAGVFLRAPLVGMPLSGFVGPFFLLYGLTAAVMARMESLPGALVAGMFVGIVDFSAVYATRRSSLATAAMLVVILAALLAQRARLSRAEEAGATSWEVVRELRPVPIELRRLREVVWARRAVVALVAAFALGLPWLVGDLRTPFATTGLVYAMVGVSLVVLSGWAGQISLGQFAIAGIGAAVAGGLAANHGWDFFGAVFTAAIVGAAVAVLIGLPALRIQGLYLAVTTLAFAFTVESFVLRREYFAWLLPGDFQFVEPPVLYGRLDLNTTSEVAGITVPPSAKLYLVTLAFLLLALAMAASFRRYRSGRVVIAVRDNRRLAQAFGVSPAATRLSAFAIAGFIAGLAGALFVYAQGAVDPGTYSPARSIELFVATVLGGIGSLSGAVLGALFLQSFALFGLRDIPGWGELLSLLGTSLGVLVVLYLAPGGLAELLWRARDAVLRRVAARRGIVVPSLVADLRTDEREADAAVLDTAGRAHLPAAAGSGHDAGDAPAGAPADASAGAVSDAAGVAASTAPGEVPS